MVLNISIKTNDLRTDLFNPYIEPKQVLLLLVRVELEVMAMKGYSTLPITGT